MINLAKAEPILMALASATGLWLAIPPVLAAFGHPLTDAQIHALSGLLAAVAAIVARSQVQPVAK